jgi:hypothetical protein
MSRTARGHLCSAFALAIFALIATTSKSEAAQDGLDSAVEACRTRAFQQFDAGPAIIEIRFDAGTLHVERYDHKLGSQDVSTVLTGTGTLTRGDRTRAIDFTCYLDSMGRALFLQLKPSK